MIKVRFFVSLSFFSFDTLFEHQFVCFWWSIPDIFRVEAFKVSLREIYAFFVNLGFNLLSCLFVEV